MLDLLFTCAACLESNDLGHMLGVPELSITFQEVPEI